MSEEIAKLISKSTDLISYYSAAKEQLEAEINKQKSVFDATVGQLKAEINQLRSQFINIPQEAWQEPALVNGWLNFDESDGSYNTAGYFKDSFGLVHLKGLVRGGLPGVIFILPSGYRPAGRELHMTGTPNMAGGGMDIAARIDIDLNGNVLMISGYNNWLSLDGITFRAA